MQRILLSLCFVLVAARGMAEQRPESVPALDMKSTQVEKRVGQPVVQEDRSMVTVRVSGWLSSMGPMEFDRMMDGWKAEIAQKNLTAVDMAPAGLVGVWKIQARQKDALANRLRDAAKAQGLTVEIE